MVDIQVIHLQPDDVLLIGNVGSDNHEQLQKVVNELREAVPTAKKVVVFAEAIDVHSLRGLEAGG